MLDSRQHYIVLEQFHHSTSIYLIHNTITLFMILFMKFIISLPMLAYTMASLISVSISLPILNYSYQWYHTNCV